MTTIIFAPDVCAVFRAAGDILLMNVTNERSHMEQALKEIFINKKSFVQDIQGAFNVFYPYLKIEFFTSGRSFFSGKNYVVDPEHHIGGSLEFTPKSLNVGEGRTIAEIEADIKAMLGLQTKVFRKSGNVWNVISLTDNWTLESQNRAGEFISNEMSAT